MCQRALEDHPESASLLVSVAAVLMKLDRAAEAERHLQQAAALQPDSAVIWNNVGLALRNQNRIEESLQCFHRAIELDPEFARAHYDRAFALLVKGDYAEGFREYEYRWPANGRQRPGDSEPEMLARLWGGENPSGKRMLLYAEQGFGDTVQFVRYAARLQARGANVILEVPVALRGLMQWLEPRCEVGSGDALADFDLHCPLMTLPLRFGTTPETIPPPAIFRVPEPMQAKWKEKLAGGNQLKVGLVWAGSADNPMDDRRSTHLGTFELLLKDRNLRAAVRFFSFQVGPPAAELNEFAGREFICDLQPELTAATETAAALLHMDLVITVDTFVAHLAASLGVKVWILLAFAPDWRWLLEREDSPWYPSVRLFRQRSAGDWAEVARRVKEALLIHSQR